MAKTDIRLSTAINPAEPLWKLAPTRDETGKPLSDFLMIIPKLKTKPDHIIKQTLNEIDIALRQFSNRVVFANIDMKLNTLWVSFKNQPGLYMDIVAAVKLRVPEAVIVGDMGSRLAD